MLRVAMHSLPWGRLAAAAVLLGILMEGVRGWPWFLWPLEGIAVGSEDEPPQPAAELRHADALAGIGEEDLPDHLVDVVGIGGLGRLPGGAADAERIGEVVARHA